MHPLQKGLLRLAEKHDLNTMSLRDIGEMLELEKNYPQKIKHHLDQLVRKGLIKRDRKIAPVSAGWNQHKSFFSLPVLGCANCGQATSIARDSLEGYLMTSKGFFSDLKPSENMFALKAVGHSMNRAKVGISKSSIEDGDYTIVDESKKTLNDGDYILSVIDGYANIKKFVLDENNGRIVLLSESSSDLPPIYIHEEDAHDFMVNGTVVGVIKRPNVNLERKDA